VKCKSNKIYLVRLGQHVVLLWKGPSEEYIARIMTRWLLSVKENMNMADGFISAMEW